MSTSTAAFCGSPEYTALMVCTPVANVAVLIAALATASFEDARAIGTASDDRPSLNCADPVGVRPTTLARNVTAEPARDEAGPSTYMPVSTQGTPETLDEAPLRSNTSLNAWKESIEPEFSP